MITAIKHLKNRLQANRRKVYLTLNNHSGSVEHYYHFLLGFLAPLVLTHKQLKRSDAHCSIYIRSCAIMDRHLFDLDLKDTHIVDKALVSREESTEESGRVRGRNTAYIKKPGFDSPNHYHYDTLYAAGSIIMDRLSDQVKNIQGELWKEDSQGDAKIVFIDRTNPDSFYGSSRCEIKTAGRDRRSIENYDEALNLVRSRYTGIRGVTLEGRSLAYQIALFNSADVVIAQHGAALANLIWCRPGTVVIEIFPRDRTGGLNRGFFLKLARCMKLQYRLMNQPHSHSSVDARELLDNVQNALAGMSSSASVPH